MKTPHPTLRAIGLAVFLALSAFAEPPADAPVVLKAGVPAPVDGVLLPDARAIAVAKRLTACEAAEPVLKKGVEQSAPWWVVPIVVVVAAGAGVGVGLALQK